MGLGDSILGVRRGARSRVALALGAGCTLLVVGCTRARPGETTGGLPPLDPAEVARGRAVYAQSCASCHGPRAEGAKNWAVPDARGNLPAPPHDDSGHTWRHSDKELAELIRNGWRDPFNKTDELTMPPFKDKLSDEGIRSVITYFKSLWSEEHRRWQIEESRREPAPSPGRKRQ